MFIQLRERQLLLENTILKILLDTGLDFQEKILHLSYLKIELKELKNQIDNLIKK